MSIPTPPRKSTGAALGIAELQLLSGARTVRLSVTLVIGNANPNELRGRFANALREAISKLWSDGALDVAEADELRPMVIEEPLWGAECQKR